MEITGWLDVTRIQSHRLRRKLDVSADTQVWTTDHMEASESSNVLKWNMPVVQMIII